MFWHHKYLELFIYSQVLGCLSHLSCYGLQFAGLSILGSPGDWHQILKVINWPLMAINPILNVMYQLLVMSIHGHTYIAASAAETNSLDTVRSC